MIFNNMWQFAFALWLDRRWQGEFGSKKKSIRGFITEYEFKAWGCAKLCCCSPCELSLLMLYVLKELLLLPFKLISVV